MTALKLAAVVVFAIVIYQNHVQRESIRALTGALLSAGPALLYCQQTPECIDLYDQVVPGVQPDVATEQMELEDPAHGA